MRTRLPGDCSFLASRGRGCAFGDAFLHSAAPVRVTQASAPAGCPGPASSAVRASREGDERPAPHDRPYLQMEAEGLEPWLFIIRAAQAYR